MRRVKGLKGRLIAFAMAFLLAVGGITIPAGAVFADTTANTSIQDAKNAVVQVVVCVQDKLGNWYNVVGGTGFLVGTEANAQYVITNDHVANATSTNWLDEDVINSMLAISEEQDITKVKTKVRVVLKRDSYIDASIVQSSTEADLAILKLEQPIYNRAPIVLDAGHEPQSTEKVYALGFPGIVQAYQDDKIYTSEDVTVTDGSVSKVAASSALTGSPISYINHSAALSSGNSGGPLLNEAGYVIGVNDWISGESGEASYYYSIQIKEVTDLLDAMGIDYMKAGDSVAAPEPETTAAATEAAAQTEAATKAAAETEAADDAAVIALQDTLSTELKSAKAVDLSQYTTESADKLQQAITTAEEVSKMGKLATEEDIQNALDTLTEAQAQLTEQSGMDTKMIILIGAAVAVVAIVVVVIVIVNNNKKKAAKKNNRQPVPGRGSANTTQQGGGFQPNQGFAPRDTSSYASDDGSTPTGILNDGSSATTVLNNAGMPPATLIRKKTGDQITINKTPFKIGKERMKVDYCISGNSNISRVHADIVFKNGSFFLVDNHATNGTSVNGIPVQAGREKALTGNETIRLADEEFIFRV